MRQVQPGPCPVAHVRSTKQWAADREIASVPHFDAVRKGNIGNRATMRVEDLQQAVCRAQNTTHRAYAEIADLPTTTEYRYNPDAQAYTLPHDTACTHNRPYQPPSPGLPHGRIMPPLYPANQIEVS